jgi:hypothetical protein
MSIKLIQDEYDRGREDARADAANGIRKVFVQTRGAWGRYLFDLMRDRYGVFVEHVSDMTTEARLSYESGYNSVAHEYIESIDGPGTMERIREEVDTFRTEHYRKYFDSKTTEVDSGPHE